MSVLVEPSQLAVQGEQTTESNASRLAVRQLTQDQSIYNVQLVTFEQITQMMAALLVLASQQSRVMQQMQLREEELRMKETEKVASSLRSFVPVLIATAGVGLGLIGLATTIYPKGIFGLCEGIPGSGKLMQQYIPDSSKLPTDIPTPNLELFSKHGELVSSFAHSTSEHGSRIYGNFADSDRTLWRANSEMAQNRANEWSKKESAQDNEKSQILASSSKANEEANRTKQTLSR